MKFFTSYRLFNNFIGIGALNCFLITILFLGQFDANAKAFNHKVIVEDFLALVDNPDLDDDDDGILDTVEDSNADGDNNHTTNPTDTDGDGIPNYLDIDSDNDGILDNIEGQPYIGYVAPSGIDANGNGLDDAYEGSFGFGIVPVNTDRLLFPDYIDVDADIDGIRDNIEAQTLANFVAPSGIDLNLNGLDDAYEGSYGFGIIPVVSDDDPFPDYRDFDSDGDGIKDKREAQTTIGYVGPIGDANNNDIDDSYEIGLIPIDSDGDLIYDYRDLDSDNDGLVDNREAQTINGYIAPSGLETIIDGLDDAYEPGLIPINSDDDSEADFRDLDSDNDSCPDALEGSEEFPRSAVNAQGALLGGQDSDGIPLVANGGQMNVSATDNSIQAVACNLDCLSVPTNDCDGDGVTNEQEVTDNTDPSDSCDFITANQTVTPTTEWESLDCDGDGVINGQEVTDGTDPKDPCSFIQANQSVATTDVWNGIDCDGDGVINGQEIIDGTDPLDPCDYNSASITLAQTGDFLLADCDGDGVTNEQEVIDGTDPQDSCSFILANQTVTPSSEWDVADCDGDGVTNGQEVIDGTDPLDPCDLLIASQTLEPSAEWLALDCDNDGNPNGTDPNPLVATAVDDSGATDPLTEVTINILENDDYLPNNDPNNLGTTSIAQTGGTAQGTVVLDSETGALAYTPTADETGEIVTIIYEVCNTDPEPDVCATATVTISVGTPMIDAVNDSFTATSQNGTDGGAIPGNVFDNDTLNEVQLNPDDVILTSTPTGPLTINPDGTVEVAPDTDAGSYIIEYTICEKAFADNCDTAEVTVIIEKSDTDGKIEVNQLVTPNNDGKNDFLFIRNADKALNNTLRIYNRWGISVYEGANYNNQNNVFDGRSKGRTTVTSGEYLPSGVYFYIFEYQLNQEKITDSSYLYISQ